MSLSDLTLTHYILLYFAAINLITFFVYGFDKWMARAGAWRVSEAALWVLALIGGSVGALVGMNFFRHKTQKISFQFILFLIILLHAAAIFGLYHFASSM
ncbi:DUF1294 domain-containing protein [Patescibacteria group bacterium]